MISMSIRSKALSYVIRLLFCLRFLFLSLLIRLILNNSMLESWNRRRSAKTIELIFFQLFDVFLNERRQSRNEIIYYNRKLLLINECFFQRFWKRCECAENCVENDVWKWWFWTEILKQLVNYMLWIKRIKI